MPDNHAPATQNEQEVTPKLKEYQINALNLLDIPFQFFRVVAAKVQAEGITLELPEDGNQLIDDYLGGNLDQPLVRAAGECSARAEQSRSEIERLKLEELNGNADENIEFYIAREFCEGERFENLAMLAYRAVALKFIVSQNVETIVSTETEEEGGPLLIAFGKKLTYDLVKDHTLTTELAEELSGEDYWSIDSPDLLDAEENGVTMWEKAVAGAKRRREHPEDYPADALNLMVNGFAETLESSKKAATREKHGEAKEESDSGDGPESDPETPKKRKRRSRRSPDALIVESVTALPIAKVPNTPGTMWLSKVINSTGGSGTPSLIKSNRHENIQLVKNTTTGAVSYTRSTGETEYIVELQNPNLFMESRGSTNCFDKMFSFILQVWTTQGYGETIGFPLQALIDLGIYSAPQSARRGVNDFISRITSIVQGEKKLKGKNAGNAYYGVFIFSATVKIGYVTMRVNPDFHAEMFSKYQTFMPTWSYKLSNQTFSLLRYIMGIARQEAGKTGSFYLSINAIQSHLGLPEKEDVKGRKYKEKIQDPIERAIEEIEMAIIAPENVGTQGYNIQITPQYSPGCSIDEFLNSRIKVGVESQLRTALHEIVEKRNAYIERATKRKARAAQQPKKPAK